MSDEQPQQPSRRGLAASLEFLFEHFLWYFRLVIILGVLGLLLSSSLMFVVGALETFHLVGDFLRTMIANQGHFVEVPTGDLVTYNDVIMQVITVVDDFLVGIVLLIFGLGSYDLFISRIDPALSQNDIRPDWLIFGSLDELKAVLGKVVLMILTINFLRFSVELRVSDPVHLLYLGGGIALVSLALKFSHGKDINRSTVEALAGPE